MSPYDHYQQTKAMADYGRKTATVISIVIHVVLLSGVVWMGMGGESRREDFGKAVPVKLGGPKNTNTGGAKRKAPVAGTTREKPQPRRTRKPPPRETTKPKPRPKQPAEKVVPTGTKQASKPPPPDPDPAPIAENVRSGADDPAPTPATEARSNRARGNVREGTGSGVALELGDGSEVEDVRDLQFRSYLLAIHSAVATRWINTSPVNGMTRIEFTILRNGAIEDVSVARSSGFAFLDSQAKRAVMGAELPPLPQGYDRDRLLIAMNFNYQK